MPGQGTSERRRVLHLRGPLPLRRQCHRRKIIAGRTRQLDLWRRPRRCRERATAAAGAIHPDQGLGGCNPPGGVTRARALRQGRRRGFSAEAEAAALGQGARELGPAHGVGPAQGELVPVSPSSLLVLALPTIDLLASTITY
jgi:hypothetical protein